MAQHDMDVSNQTFTATRADINAALQALASNSSGATAPATTFAYQWWADTTSGILKQRNAANSGWVNVLNLATGVPTGAAASGANGDITSLTALAAGGLPDNSVLTNDIANGAVTPVKLSQPPTLGTAVATTSGTAVDFTGIPSWARRVTIMFNAVSTSGTSFLMVRGGAGSGVTTGYAVQASIGTTVYTETTGFIAYPGAVAAASTTGVMVLTLFGSNTWVCSSALCPTTTTASAISVGTKTFSGALDRIRITALNGTDTFDAGSINILYE
jgi:hypothetical protein